MDIRNRRALKKTAGERLAEASYSPRKLALIHTAISVGVSLLITLIDYYLNHQIAGTGGLSGMGSRGILGTVQMTLQYAQALALPFWEIGFIYAALRMFRREQVGVPSLMEGFRRFGPVLRLRLLEAALYFAVAMACMYLSSFLFVLTPLAQPMMELLEPMLDTSMTMEQMQTLIEQIPLENLLRTAVPFLVIFGVLFLVVALFLHYRFRLADFVIMDEPRTGALRAMAESSRMTQKNRWALLRLDLSFWWFYVLVAVTAVIGYLDQLLPMLGVALPISEELAWFVCYILGLLAQLVLFWYAYSHVQVTWAAAYETLRQQSAEKKEVKQPEPKQLPWEPYETKMDN